MKKLRFFNVFEREESKNIVSKFIYYDSNERYHDKDIASYKSYKMDTISESCSTISDSMTLNRVKNILKNSEKSEGLTRNIKALNR